MRKRTPEAAYQLATFGACGCIDAVPLMQGETRQLALLGLRTATLVRTIQGVQHFLLYRGFEGQGRRGNAKHRHGWTPSEEQAEKFAARNDPDGGDVVSAWIPEPLIWSIPTHVTGLYPEEHEVLVQGHPAQEIARYHVESRDVTHDDDIDFGEDSDSEEDT